MDGLKMEPGWRRHGGARLRIRQSNALPAELRGATREIHSLETAPAARGQHHATLLLRKVCDAADRAGITLVLWPQPWGDNPSMTRDQLIEWYERRFGFLVVQVEPVLMARMVGAEPKVLKLNPTMEAVYG